jgi:hypothetical protein
MKFIHLHNLKKCSNFLSKLCDGISNCNYKREKAFEKLKLIFNEKNGIKPQSNFKTTKFF